MADNEFHDSGTVMCSIHGMRYDPALSTGCIRCPRPSAPPGAKRASGRAPSSPSGRAPSSPSLTVPNRVSGGLVPRPSTPAVPFDPAYLDSNPYAGARGAGSITVLAPPQRGPSRRGLIQGIGLAFLAGVGGAIWFLRPEAATDLAKKISTFRYGPSSSLKGAMFLPSAAAERPCPLLLLVDPTQHPERICLRFAKRCEDHGVIAISSEAFGGSVKGDDPASATLLLEYARANANTDGSRVAVAGFDVAADIALRLAAIGPEIYSGAILECTGLTAWRDVGAITRPDVAYFLFTRSHDPSREPMMTLKDEMQQKGLHVTFDELPGEHEPMTREELDPAFAFIDSLRD